MPWSKLIIPLGIFTWTVMVMAVLTGRRLIKAPLAWHKILAALALTTATIHGLIVIALYFF